MSVPRLPWVTLSIAAAAAAFHALGVTPDRLAYVPREPTLLGALACHLVHFSALHARWDISTFVVVSSITEYLDRRRLLAFLAVGALLVPPLACALHDWVSHYAGLSGLVVGQVALWLARELRRSRPGWVALLLGLLFAKQLYECVIGNTSILSMDYQGFHTVPGAHLVSALIGVAAGALGAKERRGRLTYRLRIRARNSRHTASGSHTGAISASAASRVQPR